MKAKLTIDGKEFEVDISEEQVQALTETKTKTKTKKKTGYERVVEGNFFYVGRNDGTTDFFIEDCKAFEDKYYECADYYSDTTVAKNNARADKLYRQLRRFAVENRKKEIDWNNGRTGKFFFYYDHNIDKFDVSSSALCQEYGNIYFDSEETTQLAINTFKDELLWYFTEYKDSL